MLTSSLSDIVIPWNIAIASLLSRLSSLVSLIIFHKLKLSAKHSKKEQTLNRTIAYTNQLLLSGDAS